MNNFIKVICSPINQSYYFFLEGNGHVFYSIDSAKHFYTFQSFNFLPNDMYIVNDSLHVINSNGNSAIIKVSNVPNNNPSYIVYLNGLKPFTKAGNYYFSYYNGLLHRGTGSPFNSVNISANLPATGYLHNLTAIGGYIVYCR